MKTLPNKPLKGFYDWFPEEFKIRKKIFDIWRNVCLKFGYEEYLTPTIEISKLYKEKSGDEVGEKELYSFFDKAGRELALRPEMTPGLARMISRRYNTLPKPIRYFSIANFFRNQKPQRGRNREFWQLNYDILGSNSYLADVEVLHIAFEIMFKLGAPKNSFKAYINNRKLLNSIVLDLANINKSLLLPVLRLLDKYSKLSQDIFIEKLVDLGIKNSSIDTLLNFMHLNNIESLINTFPQIEASSGFIYTNKIIKTLKELGFGDYLVFTPNIVRGFDYYDGLIFEFFDLSKKNNRSLFGGGRYNNLGKLFGVSDMPAVGCAPGDEPLRLFIDSWDLFDKFNKPTFKKIYAPLLDLNLLSEYQKLVSNLRNKGYFVEVSLDKQSLVSALRIANKRKFNYLLIFGSLEHKRKVYKIKDLFTGKEQEHSISMQK